MFIASFTLPSQATALCIPRNSKQIYIHTEIYFYNVISVKLMIILLLPIYIFLNMNLIQKSCVQFLSTQSYNHETWSNDFGITTNNFHAISCDRKSEVSALLKSTFSTMQYACILCTIIHCSTEYNEHCKFINVLYSL